MEAKIKVSTDKLISTATEFQTQGQKVRTLTQQMLENINSLSSTWEGDAQKSYCAKFKALDGDMAQIKLKIDEHVSDLKEIAQNYKQAENTNTTSFNSLKSDYIS